MQGLMGSELASVRDDVAIAHRFDEYEPVGNRVAVVANVSAEEVTIAIAAQGNGNGRADGTKVSPM